jgi:flagellar hook-basal body complex protein FliE
MTIQPRNGLVPPDWSNRVNAKQPGAQPRGSSFSDELRGAVEHIDDDQHHATSAMQDLLSGKTNETLPVVSAVAKADLSFQLLMGVRNRVIEAYKQVMQMQI